MHVLELLLISEGIRSFDSAALRHHQDNQAIIFIDPELSTSKLINQKTFISKKVSKRKSYLAL